MTRSIAKLSAMALAAASLSACVSAPSGPSMLVLPGSRSSFEAFQGDDWACRDFASQSAGSSGKAEDEAVRDAAVATAVGAAAGAMIGAAAGDPAGGAAVGAGTGLIVGATHGAAGAGYAGVDLQRRYDHAYVQCMYAKGHQVPMPGGVARTDAGWRDDRWARRSELRERQRARYGLPPGEPLDAFTPPPPPEGEPPPPPPGFE